MTRQLNLVFSGEMHDLVAALAVKTRKSIHEVVRRGILLVEIAELAKKEKKDKKKTQKSVVPPLKVALMSELKDISAKSVEKFKKWAGSEPILLVSGREKAPVGVYMTYERYARASSQRYARASSQRYARASSQRYEKLTKK